MNWKFWENKPTTDLDKKNSDEPWVQVIGEHIDPKRGLQIELDWNDAFVEYLRANGFSGSSDESIVQKWLAQLYQHLIEEVNPGNQSKFE